jgi:CRP/FNR family transcriptional regulator
MRLCIPSGLTQQEIEHLSRLVVAKKTLQRGDCLYRKGDKFRGIFAIKAGTAKMVTYDLHGNEYVTGLLLPGELLGFDAFAADRHECSAIALETVRYCELPADRLDELCREVPKLLRELFRHASAKLYGETSQIVLTKRPADERVAAFLLDISRRLQRRGFSALEFRLSLTRQDIGSYLGLALETVSRILGKFADEGLIGVHSKHVRIFKQEALQAICTGSAELPSA